MKRNVQELLDKVTGWEREGHGVIAVCPAHSDGHPSLRVDINESGRLLLYCRAGCSFGDVTRALGMNVSGSWEWPADLSGVGVTSEETRTVGEDLLEELAIMVRAASRQMERGLSDEAELALDYAMDRFGLGQAEVDSLRLGVTEAHGLQWAPAKRSWNAVPRLVVPFIDFEGTPHGAQARALEDHEVRWTGLANMDGATWGRYGVFLRDDGLDHVVITEGPSDALTAYGAGFSAVLVRGAALHRDSDMVDELADNLRGSIVSVAGDRDAAGDAFRESLVAELTARGVDARPLLVPEPHNDLNEWRMGDPSSFADELNRAIRGAVAPGTRTANEWDAFPSLPATTNVGAAEALLWFIRNTGRDICYVRGYGSVIFDAGRWWPGHENRLRGVVHEAGRAARIKGDPDGDLVGQAFARFGQKMAQRYFIDSTLSELEAMVPEHEADEMDAAEHLLLVENGVVDLRTGNLLTPTPDMLLSKLIPFSYDPEAEAPRWERFVMEVMEEKEDLAAFLKRLVGYGITGSTREQCFAVLYGRGANGKSVFVDVLAHVFSGIARTVPFALFENGGPAGSGPSPELARLRGARLTLTAEGEQGAPLREPLIKSLTGSDIVTARHLYQEDLEFHPRHLIMMATNHKPVILGADEGIWRRVKLVPFARYFAPDERDHYLTQTLKDEAEGILTWAVQGAREWYSEGLKEPEETVAMVSNMRQTSNLLGGFFPGVVVWDEGSVLPLAQAFRAWEDWAAENAEQSYTSRWLGREMEARGVEKKRSNKGVVLVGVRLTTEAEREELY